MRNKQWITAKHHFDVISQCCSCLTQVTRCQGNLRYYIMYTTKTSLLNRSFCLYSSMSTPRLTVYIHTIMSDNKGCPVGIGGEMLVSSYCYSSFHFCVLNFSSSLLFFQFLFHLVSFLVYFVSGCGSKHTINYLTNQPFQ